MKTGRREVERAGREERFTKARLPNAWLSFHNNDAVEVGHGRDGLMQFVVSTNQLRGRSSSGHSFLSHEGSVEPRRLLGDGRPEVTLQSTPEISHHAEGRTWLTRCLQEFGGQAGQRLVFRVVGERRKAEPECRVDLSLIVQAAVHCIVRRRRDNSAR